MGLNVGGFHTRPDYVKLGPSLLIATCLIVAIRTAKWPPKVRGTASDRDLEAEIAYAVEIADSVLGVLLHRKADLFASRQVPWYTVDEEDSPK